MGSKAEGKEWTGMPMVEQNWEWNKGVMYAVHIAITVLFF